ncbi:MAG TPA: hypothetical protein VFF49_04555 [Thermodesulfobacteriota bacterium]|nr:hypothetical protein [Thermodesulfobacteriota bacterium]
MKVIYEDLYIVDGKVTVLVADEKGKITGTTELLLKEVWIKVPKQPVIGGLSRTTYNKLKDKQASGGTLSLKKISKLYKEATI